MQSGRRQTALHEARHAIAGRPARDVGNRFALEPGQDLLPVVSEVDRQGAWFPAPPVALEDLIRHGLERNGIAGVRVIRIPVMPRCEQGSCPGAGTVRSDRTAVTDGVPDTLSLGLAVEEVALAARRQDADTEALETGIANLIILRINPARRVGLIVLDEVAAIGRGVCYVESTPRPALWLCRDRMNREGMPSKAAERAAGSD